MLAFAELYATACARKGGASAVEASLPKALAGDALQAIPDARFLSQMSRRIFRAGLRHAMVDKKWPAFEEAFQRFDPHYCAMLSDESIDKLLADTRLIRHLAKIKSVRHNAQWMLWQARESGRSFASFVAQWPVDDIVGLWGQLRKQGSQLGGISGAYFLRMMGKDTFLLTRDVVAVLKRYAVIEKEPKSMRDFKR
ncbi:MAG: DNA-3-methyladenine glycosylase I, partial [Cellvibrionaceae bacterium]|nr:DNA-3-methyladenine glycosylase I [Cellvibrionaceae bacterium]